MESFWQEQLNNASSLDDFSKFIYNFFSSNGDANKIRSLYNKLHDDTYANKTVFSIDLNMTRSLFNDYEKGFLRHLAHHVGEVNIIGITDIGNDRFLEEIFNGKLNKPIETKLCDAIGNLEVLVDLVDDIRCMSFNQNRISDKVCYDSYTRFITNYLKKMMREIIYSYEDIYSEINAKRTNRAQKYKLFM